MRERLIQLLQEAEGQAAYYDGDDAYGVAADYLIDNGVILPPVKVGQTVWWCSRLNGIFKYTIARIVVSDGKMCYYDNYNSVWHDSDIGKHLFLTHEAAEAALKARENNAD